MDPHNTKLQPIGTPVAPLEPASEQPREKGAIGVAFLVWLFGGGLGLAILVFVLVKMC